MTESIDHDRLFKELISTFFIEFIDLFFPAVLKYLDTNSVTLLDKEIFTDVTAGEKYETDSRKDNCQSKILNNLLIDSI